MNRTIRVCQNTTCRKQGAAEVLAAFERAAEATAASDNVTVEGSSCLGHCGSGPTVLILPENEWCLHVRPKEVKGLVRHHIGELRPAPVSQSEADQVFRLWLWVIGGAMGVIALLSWLIAKHSYYV